MDYTPKSPNLHTSAIDASLNCRWDEAVKLNKNIIRMDGGNIDAYNRLARAYMELGRYNLAKRYYSETLKYDPYNPIAIRNLKIIKSFKSNGEPVQINGNDKISASLFLQEPGKTKIVTLLNVAEPQILSKTFCGMKVYVVFKGRKITIADLNGIYLGVLPDDICYNIIRLTSGGNRYEFFIKSIKVNSLSVLIKETFRSKRFKNQPSFLDGTNHVRTNEIISHIDSEAGEGTETTDGEEETGS